MDHHTVAAISIANISLDVLGSPADSLLLGESLHRRYSRGALRRQQTSGERYQRHNAESTREDGEVESRYTKKHRLHGLARQPGSDEPQQDSAGEKAQGDLNKVPADVARLRSQSHAQSDFAPTLRHRETQHTIGANGGEKQGYPREEASQQRR